MTVAIKEPADAPSTGRVAVAFAAVYLVWGSTYLAIQIATDTLPPFLMASARFLVAGTVMYAWARWRGAEAPRREHWKSTIIVGGLLLLGGNGCVVWAESGDRVPSGLAALLVATVPLWLVLFEWLRPGGNPPTRKIVIGLALGFIGIAILVGPDQLAGGKRVNPFGAAALICASFSWSLGSMYSRHAPMPPSPLLATAMEMLAGGALLAIFGSLAGDWQSLQLSRVTLPSIEALGYLIVFGSFIGFSAYVWLLRVSTPARVGTYAYVNPVVAVLLGWALHHEPLVPRTLLAMSVIVAGVAFITIARRPEKPHPAAQPASRSAAELPAMKEPVSQLRD